MAGGKNPFTRYALATVYYGDLEPDFTNGWKLGVRAALGPDGTNMVFQPDDWGAIGAWAWGLSRRAGLSGNRPRD